MNHYVLDQSAHLQIADRVRQADRARLGRAATTDSGLRRRLVAGWKSHRPSLVLNAAAARGPRIA